MRRIAEVKSRLQRTNPVDHPDSYNKMFGELAALEQHRRTLRDQQVGSHEVVARGPRPPSTWRGRAAARLRRERRRCRRSAGTRDAFYLGGEPVTRVPWEQVEAADWDRDESEFRVIAVGSWGEERSCTPSASPSPAACSSWCASGSPPASCYSATCPLDGRRGVRGDRPRAPRGRGEIAWFYEYDEGVDPARPGRPGRRRRRPSRGPRRGRL